MFHMLSCFNLKPDDDIDDFRRSYNHFVDEMRNIDLVESYVTEGHQPTTQPTADIAHANPFMTRFYQNGTESFGR